MKIDLVIIATRRPDLLQKTIDSFKEKVTQNFDLQNVIINIDPVWGSEEDHRKVKEIMEANFKQVRFIEPEKGDFCAAVKNAWSSTTADLVFHLEEDWIALEKIEPKLLEDNFEPDVGSLALMSANKNWNGKQVYHYRRYRPWYLPFKIEDKTKPYFGTSPSFWKGDFLRECAKLMDTDFDPEKQFYSGVNSNLEIFIRDKKCKFLAGNPNLVQDIGREWHKEHGFEKKIIDGKSVWKKE